MFYVPSIYIIYIYLISVFVEFCHSFSAAKKFVSSACFSLNHVCNYCCSDCIHNKDKLDSDSMDIIVRDDDMLIPGCVLQGK